MAMAEFRKDLKCPIRQGMMVTEGICFEASRIKSNQMQFCLPEKCDSSYRLCPACMVQLSPDQIRKIIEKHAKREILVMSNGNGFLLCKFHLKHGPDATREGRGIEQPLGDKFWTLIFGRSRKETDICFEPYDLKQPARVEPVIQTAAEIVKSQPISQKTDFEVRKVTDFQNFMELSKAMKEVESKKGYNELFPMDVKAREIAEIFGCHSFLAEILLSEYNGWMIKYLGPSVPQKDRLPIDVAHELLRFPLEQRFELAAKCIGKDSIEGYKILKPAYARLRNRAYQSDKKEKITSARTEIKASIKPTLTFASKPKTEAYLPDSKKNIPEGKEDKMVADGEKPKKTGFLDSDKLAEIKKISFGYRIIQLVKEVSDESGLDVEQLAEKIDKSAQWIEAVLAIEKDVDFAALDSLDLSEILTLEIGTLFRLIPSEEQGSEADKLDVYDGKPKEALKELKRKLKELEVDDGNIKAMEKLSSELLTLKPKKEPSVHTEEKILVPAPPNPLVTANKEKKSRRSGLYYELTEEDKELLKSAKNLSWGEWPNDKFLKSLRIMKEKGVPMKALLSETDVGWLKLSAWLNGGYKKHGVLISRTAKDATSDLIPFFPTAGPHLLQLPYYPVSNKQELPDVKPLLEAVKQLKEKITEEEGGESMAKKISGSRRKNITEAEKEKLGIDIARLRGEGKKDSKIAKALNIPPHIIWRYFPKSKAAAKSNKRMPKEPKIKKRVVKKQPAVPEQQGDPGLKMWLEFPLLPKRVADLEAKLADLEDLASLQETVNRSLIDFIIEITQEKLSTTGSMIAQSEEDMNKIKDRAKRIRELSKSYSEK